MERIDDLNDKGLKILQNDELFCFGTDAILLASFISLKKGDQALDLCTGSGIIPILLCTREQVHITGVELQTALADLARRSVEMNEIENVRIINGDIRTLSLREMDVVSVNPPYEKEGGIPPKNESERIARFEIRCTLDDVITAAAKALKPKGRFYMIHKTSRMAEAFSLMHEKKIEPKRLRMIKSFADSVPNLFLCEGVKNAAVGLKTERDLVVLTDEKVYTSEVKKIYHIE